MSTPLVFCRISPFISNLNLKNWFPQLFCLLFGCKTWVCQLVPPSFVNWFFVVLVLALSLLTRVYTLSCTLSLLTWVINSHITCTLPLLTWIDNSHITCTLPSLTWVLNLLNLLFLVPLSFVQNVLNIDRAV